MHCKNCGKNLNEGGFFCSNCGLKIESLDNNINQNSQKEISENINVMNSEINKEQGVNNFSKQSVKVSKNTKVLVIVGVVVAIIVGFIILFVMLFFNIFSDSNKLVCKSDEGDITIMYDESQIIGYVANGISYDLDSQKEYAKKVGVDTYMIEFNNWFISNTSGICSINGKEV